METSKKDTLVLGIGNFLMGDEGVGIHIIRQLEKIPLKDNVEVMDGGTYGLGLIPYIEGRKKVILVDAVESDLPTGTIVQADLDEIELKEVNFLSVHQQGLQELLFFLRHCQPAPVVVLYGVVVRDYNCFSTDLTPEVETSVLRVVSILKKEIGKP